MNALMIGFIFFSLFRLGHKHWYDLWMIKVLLFWCLHDWFWNLCWIWFGFSLKKAIELCFFELKLQNLVTVAMVCFWLRDKEIWKHFKTVADGIYSDVKHFDSRVNPVQHNHFAHYLHKLYALNMAFWYDRMNEIKRTADAWVLCGWKRCLQLKLPIFPFLPFPNN